MRALAALTIVVVLVACREPERTPRVEARAQGTASASDAPASDARAGDAAATTSDAGGGLLDAALDAPDAAPSGAATLVLQRVDTQCMMAPGEVSTAFLGHDLLLELTAEGGKPVRTHVFCPPLTDGGAPGAQKPTLNVWQMCRSYPTCRVVNAGPDSGLAQRAEIACGTERLVLEVEAGRTMLKGSFGTREIAPFPMRIAPVRRMNRIAHVDC